MDNEHIPCAIEIKADLPIDLLVFIDKFTIGGYGYDFESRLINAIKTLRHLVETQKLDIQQINNAACGEFVGMSPDAAEALQDSEVPF